MHDNLSLKDIQDLTKQVDHYNTQLSDVTRKMNDQGAKVGEILEAQKELGNELKEIKKQTGKIYMSGGGSHEIKSIEGLISKAIGEAGESLLAKTKSETGLNMNTKAVAAMSSANLTGSNYVSYLDHTPGMRPMGQTRFRDFARSIPSDTDYVQFPVANGGEGAFARQSAEGAAKNQVDYDFTMEDITLTPIAGYATVSRQALRNIRFLQSYLPQTMLEDLLDKEDALFSAALIAAATGSTTSTGSNEIEKIVHFIRNLRKAKYNPNAVAVDPDIWSNVILTTTASGYNLPNVVTVDANGTVRILGRPVSEVNWLTGGNVIVGDWSRVAIVESEGLSMRQSDSHGNTFTQNQVTFLLERTEDLAIFRPDAFVVADLIA